MKIACLIPSLSRRAGGAHDSVRQQCRALAAHPGTEVHVLGMNDDHTLDDLAAWSPLSTHIFRMRGPRQFGYAPGLKKKLLALDADLLITHGLWMYPSVVAHAWHRETGRPFMMNPHGMLEPWALKQSSWRKWIAGLLLEQPSLRKAACIRALCAEEARSIRAYGLENPICVVPNGVDLPDLHETPMRRRKTLLYLGRIHPKKGLANLLHAWARLQRRRLAQAGEWELLIAGWDQGGHEHELKNLARELAIESSVHFSGPQFGRAKDAIFDRADAFVLPSLSEGLPLAVLEAWAHGLPVIMTPACHLPEGFEAGAAILAEPVVPGLAHALHQLFAQSPTQRERMGRHGCRLVVDRFNWAKIGTQMHDVCQWLLGSAKAPGCVISPRADDPHPRAPAVPHFFWDHAPAHREASSRAPYQRQPTS